MDRAAPHDAVRRGALVHRDLVRGGVQVRVPRLGDLLDGEKVPRLLVVRQALKLAVAADRPQERVVGRPELEVLVDAADRVEVVKHDPEAAARRRHAARLKLFRSVVVW